MEYANGDLTFSLSGDQDDDKAWHGTEISGNCVVSVDKDKHVTFSKMDATLVEESEEPDEPEPEEHEPEEHEPEEHEPEEHETHEPPRGEVV